MSRLACFRASKLVLDLAPAAGAWFKRQQVRTLPSATRSEIEVLIAGRTASWERPAGETDGYAQLAIAVNSGSDRGGFELHLVEQGRKSAREASVSVPEESARKVIPN